MRSRLSGPTEVRRGDLGDLAAKHRQDRVANVKIKLRKPFNISELVDAVNKCVD
jgi:hypothetical protein